MPLHRHRAPRRPGPAVLAALLLPACAAWLAAAPPAAAQAPIEAPRLRNEAEIDRQVAARHPPALRQAGIRGKVWIELPIHFEVEAPAPPQPDSAAGARTPGGDPEDAGAQGDPAPGATPSAPSPTRSPRPAG